LTEGWLKCAAPKSNNILFDDEKKKFTIHKAGGENTSIEKEKNN
jgi:hypothetical protein